ncbi:RNA polymerase sigma factor [Dongia sp.]|uniref:RNA polymerase sigma factor n=1 Tax=Dongia sp. TaxID=1977262 RepID=UPI0035B34245
MRVEDFNALFRRYAKDLTRFLQRRVTSPDLAADIAQEAFLRVMQAKPRAPIADPRAYLFRTAANLAVNQRRHQRVLPMAANPEVELALVADRAPLQDRIFDGRAQLTALTQAIAELPPRQREAFRLHALHHLSPPEIAERLGISRNMVERHLRLAIARCLERMPDLGQDDLQ